MYVREGGSHSQHAMTEEAGASVPASDAGRGAGPLPDLRWRWRPVLAPTSSAGGEGG